MVAIVDLLPLEIVVEPPRSLGTDGEEHSGGEQRQVSFAAVNADNEPTLGTAVYNVSPPQIGAFFYKIECFCFTEQLLLPGERKEFPVLFYVDPGIADDADGREVNTITLSYTFYNKGREALERYVRDHHMAALPAAGVR